MTSDQELTFQALREVLAAFAEGLTASEAAQRAGCSLRSAERRHGQKAFKRLIARTQDAIVERAIGIMAANLAAAASELARLMTESKDERVRLRAAATLIDSALRARHGEQADRRIQDLSGQLAAALATVRSKRGE